MPKNISIDGAKVCGAKERFSAFCIAATNSGSGKTTITLALLRALKRRGLKVQPFKCGPDYIDPGFHQQAAGRESINLDTWMMSEKGVKESFSRSCLDRKIAVVEGVMGLFDGFSASSLVGSSADCARLLNLPVILVVNAKGMAGSIAPLVKGFCEFNDEVKIAAVIANNVGSESHTKILRDALEYADLPPLLGGLPKNPEWQLQERHLGLTPFLENEKSSAWFENLADAVEKFINVDKLLELTEIMQPELPQSSSQPVSDKKVRLALARDSAFHFYYPDNLYLLRQAGFEIVEFSPLTDKKLPEGCRMVMLGGGFPEMFAAELTANHEMRQAIKGFADNDGFIYAECGGFMYLGESLSNSAGETFPMCGVIPGDSKMTPKLRSLGYREVTTLTETPFGPADTTMRGHEFHWSEMELRQSCQPLYRQQSRRGGKKLCGAHINNVFASYIHIHFISTPKVVDYFNKAFS
jgi:cobyrinic acid a,c-diamide synthase